MRRRSSLFKGVSCGLGSDFLEIIKEIREVLDTDCATSSIDAVESDQLSGSIERNAFLARSAMFLTMLIPDAI